tara:strand:+ start:8422 stop:10935 length:2514 start_codon:yes stop_codon:yes gene_type:complete
MPTSGLFDKDKGEHLAKRILDFYEDIRYNYLSAKEDPKKYGQNWKKAINKIRNEYDDLDDFARELKKYVDEDLIHSDSVLNVESVDANKLFKTIKEFRFKSKELNDPFSQQLGDRVIEVLLDDESVYAKFIHYALRSHEYPIRNKSWETHNIEPDTVTEGAKGLDLKPSDIPLYIIEHYGDDSTADKKRIKSKYKGALSLLKKVYLEDNDIDSWNKLLDLDISKEDTEKSEIEFIVPNKPMYRIFEVKDIESLKGFTGEWLVQEKYDGIRIQIHKDKESVKIFSYNQKDITNKCKEAVKELKKKKYGDMILDAELILYDNDEPLHRADTIAHLFKDKYEDATLKVKVFDIMNHESKSLLDTPLRERINVLWYQFTQHSSDAVSFPSKKNTRLADSLSEIEKYSKDIMESKTSEGVVIKDLESTYYIGTKKNPKWIKLKKFVDLDLIVLNKNKTKSNLYSYVLGVGPLSAEDSRNYNTTDLEGKEYLKVGKALNTKENVEIGSIVRVKVDEVRKVKDGFSLYSAKVIEIPEVDASDKLITLELLSQEGRKTLKYNVENALKKFYVSDGVHGKSEILLKSDYDGYTIYGFKGDDLMNKNAISDLDSLKQELEDIHKTKSSDARIAIRKFLKEEDPEDKNGVHIDEIFKFCVDKIPELTEELWENNKRKLRNWLNDQHDFMQLANNKFTSSNSLIKEEEDSKKGTFKLYKRKDENLDLIITYKGKELIWTIDIDKEKDIFNLFGKANKYPAEIARNSNVEDIVDKGEILIGVQKHGYHEYKLLGDKFETRLHFRVVPVDEQNKWLAWTGYKQTMLDDEEDEGLWDIYNDRHKKLTMKFSN